MHGVATNDLLLEFRHAQHVGRWLDGPVDLCHFLWQCGGITPKHLIVTLA
jgi:hypothetical protein